MLLITKRNRPANRAKRNEQKMSNPPFYLKNGQLSRYGLICGYQMTRAGGKITMYQEHGHYHVVFLFDGTLDAGRRDRRVFGPGELTLARKFYNRAYSAILAEQRERGIGNHP